MFPLRRCTYFLLGGMLLLEVAAIDLRRGPYLLAKHATGITVKWRTDAEVRERSAIWYGEVQGKPDQVILAREPHHHFPGVREWEVTLQHLKPDTTYYYAIEVDHAIVAGADEKHWFRTEPRVSTSRRLRFWLLGDSGSNRPRWNLQTPAFGEGNLPSPISVRNGFRRFNRERVLDAIILLGDNAYPLGTDRQYQAAFFNVYHDELIQTALLPCVGNHDLDDAYPYVFKLGSNPDLHGHQSKFPYYYSQDIGNVHFVFMDPWKLWLEQTMDASLPSWQLQLDWLKQDLASAEADWIVVVNHFPVYCDGNYHSDTNEPLKLLREMLVPIFDEHGVDMVFAGHDHTYQRSYLVRGHTGLSTGFDPETYMASRSDGRPSPIHKQHGPNSGVVYVVSGTAGGSRPTGTFNHPVMVPLSGEGEGKRGLGIPGSFLLEIEDLQAIGRMIDVRGQVLDQFRLVKE